VNQVAKLARWVWARYWVRAVRNAWRHMPGAGEGHRLRLAVSLAGPAILAILLQLYLGPGAAQNNLEVIGLGVAASIVVNALAFGLNLVLAPPRMEGEDQVQIDQIADRIQLRSARIRSTQLVFKATAGDQLLRRLRAAQQSQEDETPIRAEADRWDGDSLEAVMSFSNEEDIAYYQRDLSLPQPSLADFLQVKSDRLREIHKRTTARLGITPK
jgi:hypothetical protein